MELKIANLLIQELPRDPFFLLLGKDGISRRLIPEIFKHGHVFTRFNSDQKLVGVLLAGRPSDVNFLKLLATPRLVIQFIRNLLHLRIIVNASLFYCFKPKYTSTFEILWIAVEAEHHGKGIGRTLILDLLNYCERQKISEIRVKTLVETPQNIQFYQKNGFLEVLRFKGRSILSLSTRGENAEN